MPMPPVVDREGLAWAAGFFDGEGSFLITHLNQHGKSYPYARAYVVQVHPAVIERFHNCVGLGKVRVIPRSTSTGSTVWQWKSTRFEEVQAVVARLWTWLSPVKRAQATRMLRTYHSERQEQGVGVRRPRPRRSHCSRGHVLIEGNSYITKDGYQVCRACRNAWERESRLKRKAG